MSKRTYVPLLLAGILLACPAWAVDRLVPNQYGSIQAAITAAGTGDSVIVSPGTYYERINFNGKAITVRSSDPENWSVIDSTIIDGSDAGAVVTFSSGETSTSVIKGFTITNGSNAYGPGINAINGRPTISYCRIADNVGSWGGGIYLWAGYGGSVSNCIITGNTAQSGGGIYCGNSSLSITNCIIAFNSASGNGGGILNSYWNSIRHCTIYGNSAASGGGIYLNNDPCDILNTIIWGNTAGSGPQIYRSAGQGGNITYCDIQGGWTGTGNLNSDPLFVNAAGLDFHITPVSPCIDAGYNSYQTKDFENDPRPFDFPGINHGPSAYDIGADEDPAIFVDDTATGANDGTSWVNAYTSLQNALAAAQTGDILYVAQGIYKPDRGTGYTPGNRFASFQLKSNVMIRGGFKGGSGSDANTRSVSLYPSILSGDLAGNDTGTVLDPTRAENSYHVVTGNGVSASAILDGFTITAGNADQNAPDYYDCGAGIFIMIGYPTIMNCTVQDNVAYLLGGGMYLTNGTVSIIGCTFSGNMTTWPSSDGGGIYSAYSTLTVSSSRFLGNSCWEGESGGGICNHYGAATISTSVFIGNLSYEGGGGIFNYQCNATIDRCLFLDNYAEEEGGGVKNHTASPTLTNCIFVGNTADSGGGLGNEWNNCTPTVKHCTFYGNSATWGGGGIYNNTSNPTLTNCILWGNSDPDGIGETSQIRSYNSTPVLTYCCIADEDPDDTYIPFGGVANGNIDDDPLLVDPDGADDTLGTEDDNVHLGFLSPCIDAGTNAGVTTDYRGQSRPYDVLEIDHNGAQPEYDMGAFEEVMFRFTFSADNRPSNSGTNRTRWQNLLAQIRDLAAGRWPGLGQFHVMAGDFDDPSVTDTDIHAAFTGANVYWYPVVGNHERETTSDMTWIRDEYNVGHNSRPALKTHTNQDGPATSLETTYSFDYGNAHIIALNQYWDGSSDIGRTEGDVVNALYQWLIDDLYDNTKPVVMVIGHEPAFPEFRHMGDSLDLYPANRDRFWKVLNDRKVMAYLTGHTHFFNFKRVDESHLATEYYMWDPFTWQIDAGNAGNENTAQVAWSATDVTDDQAFVDIYVSDSTVQYGAWMGDGETTNPFQLRYGWSQDIPADTTAPQLASVSSFDSTHVDVVFDEWMKSTTTNVAANYSITGGSTITILSAAIDRLALNPDYDYKRVRLTLSSSTPLVAGTTYTLTINNLQDKAGNSLAAATTRQFRLVPAGSFTAFNDCVYRPQDQYTAANVTYYDIGTNHPHPASGPLIDFGSGLVTGVTVTMGQTNGVIWQADPASGGGDCNAGTDADNIFGDRTDMTGVIYYGSTGWTVTATFTDLNPSARYTFVTTANRGDSGYGTRITRYTLSDITSATNSHSTGTTPVGTYGVAFCTGYNTINGYVARWTNIVPGADGDFTVTAQADGAENRAYAFDVFMLQQQGQSGAFPAVAGAPTPANGGTGVAVPAALSVNVSDAESNPLDVTFYGRSAEAFTIAVLPDTQNYLEPSANRAIFTEQTQWIVNNRAAHNIVFVVHEGDIVDNRDGFTQDQWNQEWLWAAESMGVLYGQVPYSVLPGNHDMRNNALGQSYYDLYFPYTDFEPFDWYGGHYGLTNFNNFQKISVGGVNLLFLNLQWQPDANIIHWADMVQKAYSDCSVIFTTHGLITTGGGFDLGGGWDTSDPFPDPQDLWNGLTRNENLYMMLCGHEPGQRNQQNNSAAPAEFLHVIYTLLADYQNEPNGGNGYLRLMRFVPSADRVYVEQYSPHLDPDITPAEVVSGADYQARFVMDGPFRVIGKSFVNGSGAASMNWSALDAARTYEWYIVIGDSVGNATNGPRWSFTTGN